MCEKKQTSCLHPFIRLAPNIYEGQWYPKLISQQARAVLLALASCTMQSGSFTVDGFRNQLQRFYGDGISCKLLLFLISLRFGSTTFVCSAFHYVCLLRAQLCFIIFAEKDFIEPHLETQMNSATLSIICLTSVTSLVIIKMDEILGERRQLQSQSEEQSHSSSCELVKLKTESQLLKEMILSFLFIYSEVKMKSLTSKNVHQHYYPNQ